MAQQKMGDFMQGMKTDETRRYSDGYFDMNDDDRKDYDSVRDKFMDFFGSDGFTNEGWGDRGRGGRGGDSDSDSDSDGGRGRGGRGGDSHSDSDDVEGIVSKLRDFLGGSGSGVLGNIM